MTRPIPDDGLIDRLNTLATELDGEGYRHEQAAEEITRDADHDDDRAFEEAALHDAQGVVFRTAARRIREAINPPSNEPEPEF